VIYTVKEIFRTLQGEGANAGRAAVLCRFAGCNLWSGREQDRSSAICRFCDTDFRGTDGSEGGKFYSAASLAGRIESVWGEGAQHRFVVCTGGEPLLQLDEAIVDELHARGFEVAVETNGTIVPPQGLDWICVSPKAGAPLRLHTGDELKLVYPQAGMDPADYLEFDFRHFFLQPMDNPDLNLNQRAASEYCIANPQWRLSLQAHKVLGIR
jgi:7-carboxy-7-deazaguanine synthase